MIDWDLSGWSQVEILRWLKILQMICCSSQILSRSSLSPSPEPAALLLNTRVQSGQREEAVLRALPLRPVQDLLGLAHTDRHVLCGHCSALLRCVSIQLDAGAVPKRYWDVQERLFARADRERQRELVAEHRNADRQIRRCFGGDNFYNRSVIFFLVTSCYRLLRRSRSVLRLWKDFNNLSNWKPSLSTDILINFKTTFVNKKGEVIMKSRQIVTHYLRGWFFCDLLGKQRLHFIRTPNHFQRPQTRF